MIDVQHGNISGEDAVRKVVEDIVRTSGIINIGIGGLEIAGVTVCTVASGGACYVAVASAVLGRNRAIGEVSQTITVRAQLTPAEWGAIQAGMKPEDASRLIGRVETGVATVTAVRGVAVVAKNGKVIGSAKVATNRTPQVTINRQNGAEFEQQVVDSLGPVGGVKNSIPQTVTLSNGTQVMTIPELWGRNVGGLLEAKKCRKSIHVKPTSRSGSNRE